jgi:pyruvate formate lyase activating enzyme
MSSHTEPPAAIASPPEQTARYFTRLDDASVRCELCPRGCRIAPGVTGACRVRRNEGGTLIAETYGRPAVLQIDPIEKKPLGWYLPGTRTFSIGTFGCNLTCQFCQNHELSRHGGSRQRRVPFAAPAEIVAEARHHGCPSIAFTYNEPTVFFEYMLDVARLAREAGLGTVLVSNGYINPAPRAELYPLISAANIDIKAFSENFYASLCGGSLAPVLASCRAYKRDFGGHLELTHLIIPNRNDAPGMVKALLEWVARELGTDTPIHFSAYYPMGGFTEPPTPPETIRQAAALAHQAGFTRVKTGNIP